MTRTSQRAALCAVLCDAIQNQAIKRVASVPCRTSDTLLRKQTVVCVNAAVAYSSFKGIINSPAWPEPTVSASRDNNILLNSY